jgi:hypothetical protein
MALGRTAIKKVLILSILFASLGLPAGAAGSFEDGYKLRLYCQGVELADRAINWDELLRSARDGSQCIGYIKGVLDGLTTAEKLSHSTLMCVPNIRVGQAELLVRNYLEAHPEHLQRPAADLITFGLMEAFPCGR